MSRLYCSMLSILFPCIFLFTSLAQDIDNTDEMYYRIRTADGEDSLSIQYLELGQQYVKMGKYDSAYKYYDLSLNVASEMNDTLQLAVINKTIGSFYYECENYDQAHTYFQKSYDLYSALNIPLGISSNANNLGEVERLSGNYEKAMEYYFDAIKINEEHGENTYLVINYNNIGLAYAQLHKYDAAFYHLKHAEEIAMEKGLTRPLNNVLNSLGTLYMLIGNIDLSYKYFAEAYKQSTRNDYLIQIRENAIGLSNLFESLGQIDSALYYHKVFKTCSDSLLNNRNLMRIETLMVKNKFENEQRLARIVQQRREVIYMVVFISVFSVMVILILLWVNLRIKMRHSTLKMEHLSLERKYLDNEITSFALHISENNRLMENIRDLIRQLEVTQENTKQINELKLKLNTGLSNKQRTELLNLKVNEQHRGFIKNLLDEHPNLTEADLILCSFNKLNLTTKDIASIKGVSTHAVKIARYRLRKKLNLKADQLLHEYLKRF